MNPAGAALALVVVAAVMVVGFQTALADAGNREVISDETFTPTAGSYQALDRSNLANAYYNETVHVTDENGQESYEGEDYEWNATDGTIKPITGGNLDGDASATIDYEYRRTTERQRTLTALLAEVPSLLGVVVPFLFILLAFSALRGS